jgi:hypothetical protein
MSYSVKKIKILSVKTRTKDTALNEVMYINNGFK